MNNIDDHIHTLTALGERQGIQEQHTAEYILSVVRRLYPTEQPFQTTLPRTVEAHLTVDGSTIPCLGTSLHSGVIHLGVPVIPLHITATPNRHQSSITYSPYTASIARTCLFRAPAIAIARHHVERVRNAHRLNGLVRYTPQSHTSANILVGNTNTPHTIFLAHYDSIGPGAVDNAAAVAILLHLLNSFPALTEQHLIVFIGNEELSYDVPYTWGHGYREFEKTNPHLLATAQQIIVIDSIGQTPPQISTDPDVIQFGFPILQHAAVKHKTRIIHGDIASCDAVYHSADDTLCALRAAALRSAFRVLKNALCYDRSSSE